MGRVVSKVMIYVTVALLISSAYPLTESKEMTKSSKDVTYWGLFVAIADYNGSKADLPIEEDTLISFPNELKKYSNWKEDHMKVLINEEATLANIIEGLNWLSNVSDDDDIVLFYFSGHGAEVKDSDGDEKDGYDEAIVPWECTLDTCITDDMLSKHLDNINAHGIAIILDCCLSGEMVKESKSALSFNRELAYQMEISTDISKENRVILTSAYGDGLAIASILPNFLTMALAIPFPPFVVDGTLSAEEIFRYVQVETILLFSAFPIEYGCTIGTIAGLSVTLGGLLTLSYRPLDFLKGFIGGFIVGFLLTLISFLLIEYIAYKEIGYLVLPFPQVYDGYEGELPLAVMPKLRGA